MNNAPCDLLCDPSRFPSCPCFPSSAFSSTSTSWSSWDPTRGPATPCGWQSVWEVNRQQLTTVAVLVWKMMGVVYFSTGLLIYFCYGVQHSVQKRRLESTQNEVNIQNLPRNFEWWFTVWAGFSGLQMWDVMCAFYLLYQLTCKWRQHVFQDQHRWILPPFLTIMAQTFYIF